MFTVNEFDNSFLKVIYMFTPGHNIEFNSEAFRSKKENEDVRKIMVFRVLLSTSRISMYLHSKN